MILKAIVWNTKCNRIFKEISIHIKTRWHVVWHILHFKNPSRQSWTDPTYRKETFSFDIKCSFKGNLKLSKYLLRQIDKTLNSVEKVVKTFSWKEFFLTKRLVLEAATKICFRTDELDCQRVVWNMKKVFSYSIRNNFKFNYVTIPVIAWDG